MDTRAPHTLADGQYASRRGVIDAVTDGLGLRSLRDATDPVRDAVAWADSHRPDDRDLVARRVRHVVTEIERTADAIGHLRRGDVAAFGEAMNASHVSLRDDYEVTIPELDLAVDTALAEGALGARMTGGGFGGSAIALVAADRVTPVAAAFADAGFRPPEFLVAVPSAGAGRVG